MQKSDLYNDIEKAKEYDEQTVLKLIKQFEPLIKHYAYMLNDEDSFYELQIAFLEIIYRFPTEKIKNEAILISYIKKSIYHKYINLSVKQKQYSKTILLEDISLKEQYYINGKSNIEDQYIELLEKDLLSILTVKECEILKKIYIFQFSVTEVSKLLGITRQAVSQMKKRALEKLKDIY